MTGAMLSATIFDIVAAILIIIGFINEKKLIAFEDKIIYAVARKYKRYMRRRYIKKRAAQRTHLKAMPSRPCENARSYSRIA